MFRSETKSPDTSNRYRRVMTKYDIPRDDAGNRLCEHCLKAPVGESLGTKPRRYCSRNCRQRAYEARKTGRAIREAVAVESRRRTSRDKPDQKTRDVPSPTRRKAETEQTAAMPLDWDDEYGPE
jgi:hypothetical protein